jgi:protein-S-isoprenylcysteine O-methyltransferase Ste14
MNLMLTETLLRLAGGLLAYTTLVVVLYGVWRGTRRPTGRITGISETWLRSPWFYLVSTTLFIWAGYLLWKPLPLYISPSIRAWMLAVGSLLLFPGLSLVLWGRLALGKNYFVSSGFGAQLFAGHRLVTSGPFSIVRHPMYLGLILAAPFVLVRIHHEEKALAAEFGEEWQVYSHRVAAFWPKFYK